MGDIEMNERELAQQGCSKSTLKRSEGRVARQMVGTYHVQDDAVWILGDTFLSQCKTKEGFPSKVHSNGSLSLGIPAIRTQD
mmetsp:Transcript_6957/g.42561  ORF Transcript_6957/g.42561 Transcript_6957/m.42561 type:complete len:82 (-) Transcript_6957:3684-3929(-)